MKPHLDIAHEGNLGSERTRMEFDSGSVAHLMSILTDLYSDPALAVIREYSTNGLDSHVAASQTRPIEVELPTQLRPLFVVRDFGVGMTVDQITNQFSKYGWSSKRDSDTAVGMLGLGCKAGLSYTSQFTLVSVHDGIQVTVLVTREEDGAGAVQIIDTAATEKPNGVEVQIPVKDTYSFNTKAENFFKYWEAGQVLVNGAAPKGYIEESTLVLADDIALVKINQYSAMSDIIIMGNVPYPTETRLVNESTRSSGYRQAVVRVPIGAVDFTPSREALHITKRTTAALEAVQERIASIITKMIQDEVDKAPNAGAAARVMLAWKDVKPANMRLVYKGDEIPEYIDLYEPVVIPFALVPVQVLSIYVGGYGNRYSDKSTRHPSPTIGQALKALHVVGFKGNNINEKTKRQVRKYIDDAGLNPGHSSGNNKAVYFYGPEFGSPWLDNVNKVRYDDIKAIDLGSDAPPPRRKFTYRGVNQFGDLVDTTEVPDGAVWFCSDEGFSKASVGSACYLVGVDVFSVPRRSVNGFVKNNPKTQHIVDWATVEVARRFAAVTEADVWARHYGNDFNLRSISRLVPSRLLDPELVSVLKETSAAIRTNGDRLRNLIDLCAAVRVPVPKLPSADGTKTRVAAMKARYPILDIASQNRYSSNYMQPNDLHDLVNAVYLCRKLGLGRCDLKHIDVGLHSSLVH